MKAVLLLVLLVALVYSLLLFIRPALRALMSQPGALTLSMEAPSNVWHL